jgi:putative membrane protein insertion efficiency factor
MIGGFGQPHQEILAMAFRSARPHAPPFPGHLLRRGAHFLIRFYQLTLAAFLGRHCRYLPTCSQYMDEAITRHGLWPGGWMGVARLCRCHPCGGHGFDPVPIDTPARADWWRPWTYGRWRGRD